MDSPSLEEVDVEQNIAVDDEPMVLSEKEDEDDEDDEDDKDDKDDEDDEDDEEAKEAEEDKETEQKTEISINTENFLDNQELDDISSDETDSDEEYSENMNKLEQAINKDMIFSYHPETKQINFKELLTLSKISRNKKGQIIDPLHTTLPFLTRFEKAKILGLRAKQINHGSKPFVEITRNIIDGHTIAYMELVQNKIPFIIRRPLPNGGSEYWKVNDLKHLE